MASAAWLIGPYASMYLILRLRPLARRIARHPDLTLPLGWAAVLALLAGVAGLWAPPLPLMALLAALSGLSVLTARRDDDGGDEPDDESPPLLDWDEFDAARRRWGRSSRPGPERAPSGVG